MTRILIAVSFATLLSGCAALPFVVVGAAGTAAIVDHFDPGLGIAAKEKSINDKIVATLDPYVSPAVHWIFCNKYAASSCAGK